MSWRRIDLANALTFLQGNGAHMGQVSGPKRSWYAHYVQDDAKTCGVARRAARICFCCVRRRAARAGSGLEASDFSDLLGSACERICTGRDLAEAMDKAELSAAEARAWHKDLAVARRRLTPSLAVADK